MSEKLAADLGRLSAEARAQADQQSLRGDREGYYYASGLRDAYANAAVFAAEDARTGGSDHE